MKKMLLILSITLSVVLALGCSEAGATDETTEGTSVSTSRSINVELRSNVESSDSRTAVADGDELAMWFRSSDIEFWSTELAGGYTDLVSDLYSSDSDESDKVSISIDLPDAPETFKFEPGTIHEVEDATASFASTIYDIIRIDIGGGGFNFEHNGSSVSPVNTVTNESSSINGNSIFLISSSMLDACYYVPRDDFYDTEEELIASGRCEWLAEFISAKQTGGNNIDMDGALFIPFDGIDLSGDVSTLSIFLDWDIIGAFDDTDDDSQYEMEDRYNGTCFDFNVRIETE